MATTGGFFFICQDRALLPIDGDLRELCIVTRVGIWQLPLCLWRSQILRTYSFLFVSCIWCQVPMDWILQGTVRVPNSVTNCGYHGTKQHEHASCQFW